MSTPPQHDRVSAKRLDANTRRHLEVELWTALRLREWVRYRIDKAGGEGGKFRTVGTGQSPRGLRDELEPRVETTGRGLTAFAGLEPALGVLRAHALYLDGDAWEDALTRLEWLGIRDEFLWALGNLTTDPWHRQTRPDGRTFYRRNARQPPSVTRALEELLAFCDVVALDDELGWELHHADRPAPSTHVLGA